MVCPDNGVAFPMTDLLATCNLLRALAPRPAVGDFLPLNWSAGATFHRLLLVVRVFPKVAALGIVGVSMLAQGVMTYWQLTVELLGPPHQAKQGIGLLLHPGRYRVGIATVLRSFNRQFTGLLWTAPARAGIKTPFPAYGEPMPIQQFGFLRLIVWGFHEGANLISFSLAEMFVGHKQLLVLGQKALDAKHP